MDVQAAALPMDRVFEPRRRQMVTAKLIERDGVSVIEWEPTNLASRQPDARHLFRDFIRLGDKTSTDEDIRQFAERYGVLVLCPRHHNRPHGHPPVVGQLCPQAGRSHEQVWVWRSWVAEARALLAVGVGCREGRLPTADEWYAVEQARRRRKGLLTLTTPRTASLRKDGAEASEAERQARALRDTVCAEWSESGLTEAERRDRIAWCIQDWLDETGCRPIVEWRRGKPAVYFGGYSVLAVVAQQLMLNVLFGLKRWVVCAGCRSLVPVAAHARSPRRDLRYWCKAPACRREKQRQATARYRAKVRTHEQTAE